MEMSVKAGWPAPRLLTLMVGCWVLAGNVQSTSEAQIGCFAKLSGGSWTHREGDQSLGLGVDNVITGSSGAPA